MPPLQLLIKPASGGCNIRCRYCFYTDVTQHRAVPSYGIMSVETLDTLLRRAFDFAEHSVALAFQGGEPTLAGLDFFRTAVETVRRYNTAQLPVQYAIQTNGLMFDDAWYDFLKAEQFLVGLSLDGTRRPHDLYRVDARGDGTFSKVWAAVKAMQQRDIDFNILTVLNAATADSIDNIYHFYKKHGLMWQQYIPCLNPLDQSDEQLPYTLTAEAYGDALCRLFDLWYADVVRGELVHNRYFENLVGLYQGRPAELCGLVGHCTPQFVVEADGGVYPCDFYVLDTYKLGDVHTDTFAEMDDRRLNGNFLPASQVVAPACQTCRHRIICRGGCRRHREPHPEQGTLNRFCTAYLQFFDHADARLRQLALMWR